MRFLPALFCLVALGLGGCAGRATDTLRPVSAEAAGTSDIPILVATTRRPASGDGGLLFGGERSRRTSFNRIAVSIPPVHRAGEIEWPDRSPGDPAVHFVTRSVASLDRGAFRRALNDEVHRSGRKRVILFVHGFNNRYDEAVFRLAQIVKDSGTDALPVLFTWPSRGRLLAYPYDRESATFSRDALETLIADLAADSAVTEIAILAHSMGNWVTLEALRQTAIRRGRVPEKLRDVMLAAPDVDVDVAGTQIADLGPKRPRITLFVSQDDKALALSQVLWGSRAQLGSIDPTVEPYRSALERARITVVDLTAMNSGDPLNHAKFAQSPEVVRAIGSRLASGQSIETRGTGIGEGVGVVLGGAARTIGAAATAAVSVPLSVVDPDTRDNLPDQFETIIPGDHGPGSVASE